MREVSLSGLGTLPEFTISETNPYYYISRYCYEQSKLLNLMETENFVVQQAETTDLTGLETSFDTFIPTLLAWLSDAQQAAEDGVDVPEFDFALLPDMVSMAGLVLSGNWAGVAVLFAKIALKGIVKNIQEKASKGEGDEIAQVLKKALLRVVAEGTPEETIHSILEEIPLEISIKISPEAFDQIEGPRVEWGLTSAWK